MGSNYTERKHIVKENLKSCFWHVNEGNSSSIRYKFTFISFPDAKKCCDHISSPKHILSYICSHFDLSYCIQIRFCKTGPYRSLRENP